MRLQLDQTSRGVVWYCATGRSIFEGVISERLHIGPERRTFSSVLNFRRSAIALFVRSPGGPPRRLRRGAIDSAPFSLLLTGRDSRPCALGLAVFDPVVE